MQVLLEQLVVRLAALLDEQLAVLVGLGAELGRNLLDQVVGPQRLVLVADGLHRDQVDDAGELVLRPDRQLDGHGVPLQLRPDLLERPREVGAHAVHLVDEADARDAVLVGLAPDGLRLRLDAGHGVEHGHRAVEHAQRPLHLGREIDVAGRVDDVDAMIPPEARRRGRRDRDAALLLLLHPVHHRGPVVDLAELVRDPGVEEDALGGGGLPGIDVRHDADVPGLREGLTFLAIRLVMPASRRGRYQR